MRRLADLTFTRAGTVIAVAAIALLAAAWFAPGVFEASEPFDISDPESEVERAYAVYERATGHRPEPEVVLLVDTPQGAGAAAGREAVARAAAALETVPGVAAVSEPASEPGHIAADGEGALVLGFMAAGAERVPTGEQVAELFAGERGVLAGGIAVGAYELGQQSEHDARRIELLAAPVLLLLCLAAFRTVVAAALPLLVAGISILFSFALLRLLSVSVEVDIFSLQVVTGLGVGLAIDYSLFVVARYRAERSAGASDLEVHRRTMATAGRTVLFSSLTVAVALLALVLFQNQFLRSTGVAGGLVVLFSGVAALVVLPAVLALLGRRLECGAIGGAGRSLGRADAPVGLWRWLPDAVLGRPVPIATGALLLMLLIAAPALDSRLTTPDARVLPEDRSARQVADAIAADFPDLATTRLQILVPAGSRAERAEASRAVARVRRLEGIGELRAERRLDPGLQELLVLSPLDPLSDAAQELVEGARAAPWPEGTLVGGRAAELIDQRSSIEAKVPLVVAVVVLTNLLLVVAMLRSVLLPVLAICLNLLTVAAALGIMVAVFRSEPLTDLLGTVPQEGIDISVPILSFAVVFGLSTDYGIFLLSRIAEARAGGLGDSEAIADGLARTGRLITAGAAIFSVAVGAFVFSDLVIVKQSAVAIAVAVLLDASIVRCFLLPAAMRILGARAWWWPGGRLAS